MKLVIASSWGTSWYSGVAGVVPGGSSHKLECDIGAKLRSLKCVPYACRGNSSMASAHIHRRPTAPSTS